MFRNDDEDDHPPPAKRSKTFDGTLLKISNVNDVLALISRMRPEEVQKLLSRLPPNSLSTSSSTTTTTAPPTHSSSRFQYESYFKFNKRVDGGAVTEQRIIE